MRRRCEVVTGESSSVADPIPLGESPPFEFCLLFFFLDPLLPFEPVLLESRGDGGSEVEEVPSPLAEFPLDSVRSFFVRSLLPADMLREIEVVSEPLVEVEAVLISRGLSGVSFEVEELLLEVVPSLVVLDLRDMRFREAVVDVVVEFGLKSEGVERVSRGLNEAREPAFPLLLLE